MAHDGKSVHRLASNPIERKFHDAWQLEQEHGHILEYLLGDDGRRGYPTERDQLVAATVIQWLGSPVRQSFLNDVLSSNVELTGAARHERETKPEDENP